MNPAVIVVITEVTQLPFEISGTPEGNVIQQFATHSAPPGSSSLAIVAMR